jgi:hypothetical protein
MVLVSLNKRVRGGAEIRAYCGFRLGWSGRVRPLSSDMTFGSNRSEPHTLREYE